MFGNILALVLGVGVGLTLAVLLFRKFFDGWKDFLGCLFWFIFEDATGLDRFTGGLFSWAWLRALAFLLICGGAGVGVAVLVLKAFGN